MSNDTELFVQKNLCTVSRFVDNYGAYDFLRIMSNFSQLITTTFFYATASTNRNRDIWRCITREPGYAFIGPGSGACESNNSSAVSNPVLLSFLR